MAGGVRMGEAQAEVGRLRRPTSVAPTRRTRRSSPAGRAGSPRSGRARRSRSRSRRRATRSAGSPGSTPAAATVTPGLIDPHTHLLFGGSREGEWLLRQRGAGYLEILAAGGGILSTVAATRAASRTSCWPTAGAGSTRCSATGSRRSRRSPATASTSRPRSGSSRRPTGSAQEGPIDVVPTYLGAHAVPPEFRSRPDGTEAYVRSIIEEQLPGVAAHGRARFCDVFCESGVFGAGPVAPDPRGGRRLRAGDSGSTPTSWRRPAARSWRPSSAPLSADHLATPSEAGIDALAAGRRRGSPGRRDRPAGDDLVPHEGPRRAGADVHRARHPGRDRHGLQPRHVADGQPAAGHDRRLPRARAVARTRRSARSRSTRRGRSASRTRSARSSRARAPTSWSGACRPRPRSRTGRPRT